MKRQNQIIGVVLGLVAVIGAVFGGIALTANRGKDHEQLLQERAPDQLKKLMKKVHVTENQPPKAAVDDSDWVSLGEELPALKEEDYVVKGSGDVDLLVFCSPEKAGEDKDGWMRRLAESFNASSPVLSDGKSASVTICNVTSGIAADYIVSGKYTPDLYSPSSKVWGELANAQNAGLEILLEKTVGNTAGIAVSQPKTDELKTKYGSLSLRSIAEATTTGEIVTGYTDPFTSSTGLNFLVNALANYDTDLLSDEALAGFRSFQKNIPYVATNTQQMVHAAENGTFDAFVIESQQYENTPKIKKNYSFVPFGFRHDNPLYTCKNLSAQKQEAAALFAAALSDEKAADLARQNGFETYPDYASEMDVPDGKTLANAQAVWKDEKDSGREILAVFVADTSGSMAGERISSLKKSLINSMKYVGRDCSVGLISYADEVVIEMPVEKFDLNAKSTFKGAVENMTAIGGTASYSALAAAANMIYEYEQASPDKSYKPMIFLLSDGATNRGLSLDGIRDVLIGLRYPVFTIGYGQEADMDSLQAVSQINEAASMKADSEDILSKLKALFNANL